MTFIDVFSPTDADRRVQIVPQAMLALAGIIGPVLFIGLIALQGPDRSNLAG